MTGPQASPASRADIVSELHAWLGSVLDSLERSELVSDLERNAITAHRRILDEMSRWEHDNPDDGGYYACEKVGDYTSDDYCSCATEPRQHAILVALATAHADRPGFKPSWLDEVEW